MSRYIGFILAITLLSGCSELQVISDGALRELKAEGRNVETISYNYHQKIELKEKLIGVKMAKAEDRRITLDGDSFVSTEKKVIVARAYKVKGLWEKH